MAYRPIASIFLRAALVRNVGFGKKAPEPKNFAATVCREMPELALAGRHAHNKPIQGIAHLDLARQPA